MLKCDIIPFLMIRSVAAAVVEEVEVAEAVVPPMPQAEMTAIMEEEEEEVGKLETAAGSWQNLKQISLTPILFVLKQRAHMNMFSPMANYEHHITNAKYSSSRVDTIKR
jgi:hypothetical protein